MHLENVVGNCKGVGGGKPANVGQDHAPATWVKVPIKTISFICTWWYRFKGKMNENRVKRVQSPGFV